MGFLRRKMYNGTKNILKILFLFFFFLNYALLKQCMYVNADLDVMFVETLFMDDEYCNSKIMKISKKWASELSFVPWATPEVLSENIIGLQMFNRHLSTCYSSLLMTYCSAIFTFIRRLSYRQKKSIFGRVSCLLLKFSLMISLWAW